MKILCGVFILMTFWLGHDVVWSAEVSNPERARQATPGNAVANARSNEITIAAIVNDDVVTSEDLQESLTYFKRQLAAIEDPQKRLATESKGKADLLEELIRDRLFDQEMKRLGIEATPAEVEQEVVKMAQRAGLSPEQLRKELKQRDISRDSIVDHLRLHKFILRKIRSKIQIDEKDVLEYYENHQKMVKTPDSLRLLQIGNKHSMSSDQKNSILEAASQARAVTQLEELKKITKDVYISDFGVVHLTDLNPDLNKNLQNLPADGVSRVFENPEGWYFYKVFQEKPVLAELDEDHKNQIRSLLFEEAVQQELDIYIQNLRRTAHVEIRL